MDFINEGKTGKVKLQDIFDNIYEDCDSALADYFYKGLKSKMDSEDNIDLADAEVQLYIRDYLESHENDYQYDLLKQALEPYYDHAYDLADEDVQESYEVLEEDEYLDENATFEEIIYRMECAEIYEDLYNAAMLIVDPKLQNEVTELIQQCEDDGDEVEEAYSIVTSDLLDMHINDKNVESLEESEKKEIAEIEDQLENDKTLKGDEKVDLQNDIKYIKDTARREKRELTEEENPQEFDYRLLSRLKSDCDYYLGNGNRDAEHCLWAKNEQGQIDKMREIYNKLKEKPEWLSEEDINNYAKEMGVVDLPSTTDDTAEKEIQDMLDRSEKRSKENLDEGTYHDKVISKEDFIKAMDYAKSKCQNLDLDIRPREYQMHDGARGIYLQLFINNKFVKDYATGIQENLEDMKKAIDKQLNNLIDSTKNEEKHLDESKDGFNRDELIAVKNSIDTALDDLQILSNGTTGAMEDKVLVNDLRNVSQSVGSYLNRVNESKDIKEEANGQAPDFKVDFEGDMTIDMGYTNEEGAEKRAKELLGDVAKSSNVRDLNVDVKDVKKIERENKTLTESEEKFSGVEFEKNIPHVMRYKQYDVIEEEDGKTLYWITQQFFSLEELKKFQEAFIKLTTDTLNFKDAYVTVRDLSTYDLKEDYENGVLCHITKYDLDYEGYEEFCKEYNFDLNKGWLEESKELKKENTIVWTSEYQGDEETADEAYQEYLDEFEPSPKTPVSFEDWLQDTFDIWLDAEADNYNEEHPGEIAKLSDYEIDAIDQELRDKVQKEIEANMDDLKEQYEEYCEEIQKEMTSPADKEKWLTGWYEQDAQDQWEVVDEDFSDNIWPMIENQCNEDILILLGSVGRWNGTFGGGKIIYADEKNLRNTMSDYDDISVEADDENKLSINYMHHDGTDTMYLYTIPQDLTELAKAMNYDDPDELDTDIRQDYVDMEELAKHADLLIPIINKGRGNV